jgi:hypothetical protein
MELKQEFIRRILLEQGKEMDDSMLRAIKTNIRFKYGRSGRLENGRTPSVSGNELTLTHPIHQRFLDMKAKLRDGSYRRQKYPIHNRIVFGHYNRIAFKLMYGFTADVANEIKNTLSK